MTNQQQQQVLQQYQQRLQAVMAQARLKISWP
jgi:hypothetical protein